MSARIAPHQCSNCHLGTLGVSSWGCTLSMMDRKSHEGTLKSSSEVLVQQRTLRSRAGKGPCEDHRILELISWWPLCSCHLLRLQVQGGLLFLFRKHEDSCFGEETKHSLTWTWADPKSIHNVTQFQMTYQPGGLVVIASEIIVSNKEVAITQSITLLLIPQPLRVTQHPSTLLLFLIPTQAWWSPQMSLLSETCLVISILKSMSPEIFWFFTFSTFVDNIKLLYVYKTKCVSL